MKERLLLDRVELKGSYVSVRDKQLPTAIGPYAANPLQPIEDDTAVPARVAANLAVIQSFVKFSLNCEGFKDIFQS
jgi:hypothetical protein